MQINFNYRAYFNQRLLLLVLRKALLTLFTCNYIGFSVAGPIRMTQMSQIDEMQFKVNQASQHAQQVNYKVGLTATIDQINEQLHTQNIQNTKNQSAQRLQENLALEEDSVPLPDYLQELQVSQTDWFSRLISHPLETIKQTVQTGLTRTQNWLSQEIRYVKASSTNYIADSIDDISLQQSSLQTVSQTKQNREGNKLEELDTTHKQDNINKQYSTIQIITKKQQAIFLAGDAQEDNKVIDITWKRLFNLSAIAFKDGISYVINNPGKSLTMMLLMQSTFAKSQRLSQNNTNNLITGLTSQLSLANNHYSTYTNNLAFNALNTHQQQNSLFSRFNKRYGSDIALASLSKTQGFTIRGAYQSGYTGQSYSGESVSTAGDVNNDGISDIIIGAPQADIGAGISYVIYGSRNPSAINLTNLGSTQGFTITGANQNDYSSESFIPGDYSGESVSTAGDVNNDGISDIIIGTLHANNNAGISYVIYGSRNPSAISLANLSPTQGFTITGANANDYSGLSVSTAGDVNNDSISDIIIGANGVNNGAGASYVIYGSRNLSAINLANLDSTQGFSITGAHLGEHSGYSVSTAGDVNNDSISDIIIGAIGANDYVGASYVVYGSKNLSAINLANLGSTQGFTITGANQYGYCGCSVSTAGDVNGDGISDIIIGANGVNSYTGASYVIYGSPSLSAINLANLGSTQGFTITGVNANDYFGHSVGTAGDVNGDAISDIIIGANGVNNGTGASYIIYGSRNPSAINLANLGSTQGFTITGANQHDYSGYSVRTAGDVNGDGGSDIIIGAYGVNGYIGASYVIYGQPAPSAVTSAYLTTQSLTSSDITTHELTTNSATNAALTSSSVTSESLSSSPLTSQVSTTQPLTSSSVTTQPMTSFLTSQALTSAGLTTTPLTTQTLTTSQDMTTSPATTQSLTSSPVTSQDVTTQLATTQSITTQSFNSNPNNSFNKNVIVGGVIGGAVLLSSISGIAAWKYYKNKKRDRDSKQLDRSASIELASIGHTSKPHDSSMLISSIPHSQEDQGFNPQQGEGIEESRMRVKGTLYRQRYGLYFQVREDEVDLINRLSGLNIIFPKHTESSNNLISKRDIILGKGNFGQVRLAREEDTLEQKFVALKIVAGEESVNASLREGKIQLSLNGSENVLPLLEYLHYLPTDENKNVIKKFLKKVFGQTTINNKDMTKQPLLLQITPLAALGNGDTFKTYLSNVADPQLKNNLFNHFAFSLINGLKNMHSKNITHLDIKPSNLLIHVDGIVYIGDFGCSNEKDIMVGGVGDVRYFSPERLAHIRYFEKDKGKEFEVDYIEESFSGKAADLWAAGLTLLEIINNNYPLDLVTTTTKLQLWGKRQYEKMLMPYLKLEKKPVQDLNTANNQAFKLIKSLLKTDTKKRIDINKAWSLTQRNKREDINVPQMFQEFIAQAQASIQKSNLNNMDRRMFPDNKGSIQNTSDTPTQSSHTKGAYYYKYSSAPESELQLDQLDIYGTKLDSFETLIKAYEGEEKPYVPEYTLA